MPKYLKFSEVNSHCDLALSAINAAEEEYINRAASEVSIKTGQSVIDCAASVRNSLQEVGSDFSELRLHVKGFRNSLKVRTGRISLTEGQATVYKGIMEVAFCEQSAA